MRRETVHLPAVTLACSSPRLRADAAPEWMICMRPTACCGARPIVPGAHRQAASLTQPVGRAPAEWSFGIASAEPCGPRPRCALTVGEDEIKYVARGPAP